MASVNKVILVGNLGADPELRCFPNGEAVCSLRLATTEKWRDKASGELREATEWHRVLLFGRLAEVADDFLKKGALIYVVGRLRTRRWQDQEGKERFTAEIEASEMKMLSRAGNAVPVAAPAHERPAAASEVRPAPVAEWAKDIPF